MGFRAGDPGTLCGIILHALLANSAFIFHTPVKRVQAKPMMWREFQLHSVTFSMRSLVTMLFLWGGTDWGIYHYRGVVVLASHLIADEITRRFKQGTTMRDMPFPPSLSAETAARINLFYSLSQIFAICGVLIMGLDEAFFVLFPIQIAAFLLTLVRKDIVSSSTWHLVYGGSLLVPYVYLLVALPVQRSAELIAVGCLVALLRFRWRVNKYFLWCPVALIYLTLPPRFDPATGCLYTRWSPELQADPARAHRRGPTFPASGHVNLSKPRWQLPLTGHSLTSRFQSLLA